MKTFTNVAAQGDVFFIRINEMPEGYEEVGPENGELIVTHSETGHNHVMSPAAARMFANPSNEYDAVLLIEKPTALEHKRTFDTHEPILFEPGMYQVRRQREYTPEGYRRVAD